MKVSEAKTYRNGESVRSDLFPKTEVQVIHGETMTLFSWDFEMGTKVTSHAHHNEQITHCIAGTLEVTVGTEVVVLQAGDTVTIPSNVEHSAFAPTAVKGIDAFHPVREDVRS